MLGFRRDQATPVRFCWDPRCFFKWDQSIDRYIHSCIPGSRPLGRQGLNAANIQCESVEEPGSMTDDLEREAGAEKTVNRAGL